MTDGPWDLVVIGGGTAGIVGAKTAAQLGARVMLVERDRTGGDCLWTGCVPSKALLAAAHTAHAARSAERFGVHTGDVRVDFAAVMGHVRSAIARIEPVDSVPALTQAGVRVLAGEAFFASPTSVSVNGSTVHFRQALIATGSAPATPPVPGLTADRVLTSDTVWGLPELPRRLAVLGGGPIGCELGQAFARLGAQVTLVEAGERLLAREDPDAAAVVAAALARDGVRVLTDSPVTSVVFDDGANDDGSRRSDLAGHGRPSGSLLLTSGSTVEFDVLLVATGRAPRTAGLAVDAAGVEVDARGHVVVDRRLRTTNRRVWAAGDVTARSAFTHTAGVHASIAASNAILGLHRRVSTTITPRVTFTDPELAAVGVGSGVGSDPTTAAGDKLRPLTWQHSHVDRAIAEDETGGFTRLVTDSAGRVLGATVVGPRAGESLAELTLAVRHGMRTSDLAGTIHPYPAFTDGAWNAAIADVRARLAAPRMARAVRLLAALRRWRVGRGQRDGR